MTFIIGESGLGKSTLINSLFLADLYPEKKVPDPKGNSNTNGHHAATVIGNGYKLPGARNGKELTSQQLLGSFFWS